MHISRHRGARHWAVAVALTASSVLVPVTTSASAPQVVPPGDGHRIARHPDTGTIAFVGTAAGAPIETNAAPATPAAAVARSFLQQRAGGFGLASPATALTTRGVVPTPGGGTSVRLGQTYAGIPVLGGEFTVNLDRGRDVTAVLGEASPIKAADTSPAVPAATARTNAIAQVARETGRSAADLAASTPRLMFFDPRLLGAPSPFQRARLSWVLDVSAAGPVTDTAHLVVVDAARGFVALSFETIADARNRIVCDANNTPTQVPCTAPVWTEASTPATADLDVSSAFAFAGDTYAFYASRFGRDSLDGAGLQLKSTVDFCPSLAPADCPFGNAFWDGAQMVYGDGFATADDVVGHELTHGVTDFSSSLFYYMQSGAINEAMSDIFGELIDLTNVGGTDAATVRWLVGEDLPAAVGAIRDMEDPPAFGQPDRMLSPLYETDPSETDSGGVHSNSGVANKAAFLLTDGGVFNGQTIFALGITKVARLFYTVNTTLLVSASDYADLGRALRQACTNLAAGGVDGFTAADCVVVDRAVVATEMDQVPTTAPTSEVALCPTGVPQFVLNDNLETVAGQLSSGAALGPNSWFYPQNPNIASPDFDATYASSGTTNVWGDNGEIPSDSAIRMTNAVAIPAGAFLNFNHAFGFEDDPGGAYDGGVVEYSTTGPGGPWVDAGSLFTGAGAGGYTGTIFGGPTNPLAGRAAFVRESNGYGSSRADLSSLAGRSVMFRWRIGTDAGGGDAGWFIDDIRINQCVAPAPAPPPAPPADSRAPRTKIKKGPPKVTRTARARFTFVADEPGATFRCKLDGHKWRTCDSPQRYRVKPGRHTFKVRAVDAAHNVDASPAVLRWRVRGRG